MTDHALPTRRPKELLQPAPGALTTAFLLAPAAIWGTLLVTASLTIGVTVPLAVGGGYLLLVGLLAASPNGRGGITRKPVDAARR